MSRESVVLILGVVIVALPSLGIPAEWKFYATTACGGLLIWCGYVLRRSAYKRSIERKEGGRAADSFVESEPKEGETEVV